MSPAAPPPTPRAPGRPAAPPPRPGAGPAPRPAARSAEDRSWLDAGGSARPRPEAVEAYTQALAEGWADPHRLATEGRRARALLDAARGALGEALGVRAEDVHLAPSHTAALHAAVAGTAQGRRRVGHGFVRPAIERAAVLHAAQHAGLEPRTVPVDRDGRADPEAFGALVAQPGTALAALQHANGEVGTLQPVAQAHEAAARAGVPLLVDAGASLGHVEVGPAWDLLAADPCDWGALAGVGVLAVRPGVRWRPPWPQDEDRWFPGRVSVPAAFAAAVALQAALREREREDRRRRDLVDRVRDRVAATVPDVEVVGPQQGRLPHVVTFSCLYVDGEALVTELDRAGVAVGSGSACTSSALEPSHVLAAMGVLTHGNVRVVLDHAASGSDVDRLLAQLPPAVARVRATLGAGAL